ncbi:hypothetical protein P8A22_16420 [Streptomyces laculatispora]|uniref:Uncharacterized protein n=1 Tax=Streptomyces laculatispora TaxID=887464 RepID=A0ABY9I3J1_9ACTN|nr:hypothetical protein [Streptomyces laculatispora]WLQ41435.1 hypothetical protein P8A22_16420 [Streptomyces laculatispora]
MSGRPSFTVGIVERLVPQQLPAASFGPSGATAHRHFSGLCRDPGVGR